MFVENIVPATQSLFLRVKYGREIYYAVATGTVLKKGISCTYTFESCGFQFLVNVQPSIDGTTFDWRTVSHEKVSMSPKLIQLMGKEIERKTFGEYLAPVDGKVEITIKA